MSVIHVKQTQLYDGPAAATWYFLGGCYTSIVITVKQLNNVYI